MNVMAGGATQRVEIDTLFLESRVLPDISSVAAATGPVLVFFIADRVGFAVHGVTGRAVDIGSVMCAAHEHDLPLSHAFISMTRQTGVQLLVPG
jgi:hypothetical protein